MRQMVITKPGNVGVFQLEEVEDLTPDPGEVVVSVKASGINFADILARKGLYPDAPSTPCVVGYEVSGIISSVGKGISADVIGKAVIALTPFHGYADQVKVPAQAVFEKPESLTFEQAAAIPVNYLTAYQLLVVMGALSKHDTVLIHNAGGGVGLAALDIAKYIGAKTIGTASSHKHEFLQKRGLDLAIDYRQVDWLSAVKEATDGMGVELVIDPIGGSHWKKSYKALRATGRLGMFGISKATESRLFGKLRFLPIALQMPLFHPARLVNGNKSVFGVNLGHLWHENAKLREWMDVLLAAVKEGWVKPYVDKTFALEDVGDAHEYIEARRNIGKVILCP